VHTDTVSLNADPELAGLSYGFVAGPGRFDYYLARFRLLTEKHQVDLEDWRA
jgi:AMP nucleosidase